MSLTRVALVLGLLAIAALAAAEGAPVASVRGGKALGGHELARLAGAPLAGAGVLEGGTRRRLLHFTFDDGPDRELTPRLLDALDRAGHKATFFFSTSRFQGTERRNAFAPALAREVARRGHQVGSHGFQHQRMSRLREREAREQIDRSEQLFQGVFGTRTFLFRPPFGSRNAAVDGRLAEGRYATVMWNVGMADWNARKPEAIRLTFWRALQRNEQRDGERGGIVLLHDTHAWSVEAYALIAQSIAERNCRLLAAGEELYDVTDSLLPWAKPPSDAEHAARQADLRSRLAASCARPRAAR